MLFDCLSTGFASRVSRVGRCHDVHRDFVHTRSQIALRAGATCLSPAPLSFSFSHCNSTLGNCTGGLSVTTCLLCALYSYKYPSVIPTDSGSTPRRRRRACTNSRTRQARALHMRNNCLQRLCKTVASSDCGLSREHPVGCTAQLRRLGARRRWLCSSWANSVVCFG